MTATHEPPVIRTAGERILHRNDDRADRADLVAFDEQHTDGTLAASVRLDRETYRDLGYPATITVRIRPGDHLNGGLADALAELTTQEPRP